MNFSSLFGVLFGIGVLYGALHATTDNLSFFLDAHGILIVVGGTAAAASISFPILHVLGLMKVFVLRVLGTHRVDYPGTIQQILDLSKKATHGAHALNESLPTLKHEFLKEAVSLVAAGILSESEIRHTLEQR